MPSTPSSAIPGESRTPSPSQPTSNPEDSAATSDDEISHRLAQLENELRAALTSDGDEEAREKTARQISTSLRHLLSVGWRQVARGDLDAPGRILDRLRRVQGFADVYAPSVSPMEAAAFELRSSFGCFFMAHETLAEVKRSIRLADRERSATEQEVLRVLAESATAYLRRGQIHERLELPGKPSPARIGQILVQMASENLLMRIHAPAQGNAETAHYSLSPLGWEEWNNIEEADRADPLPDLISTLIGKLHDSSDQVMQRIQLGLMAQLGLRKPAEADCGPRPIAALVDGVAGSKQKAIISETQKNLFRNSLATDLVSLEVMEPDRDGSLRFRKSRNWENVPAQLRDEPRPPEKQSATKPLERPQTPASTAAGVPENVRTKIFAHA